jgi:diaminopimelate decarboxylase
MSATVARIDDFLAQHARPTRCVVMDLETVRQRCNALRDLLPQARIHCA